MRFRETVAVYCENHKQHTNSLCGQNAEFWHEYVKASGIYINHWALKGQWVQAAQSRESPLGLATRLRVWQPTKRGSSLFSVRDIQSLPTSQAVGTGLSSLGGKQPGREADHSYLLPRLSLYGAVPPLPYSLSWCGASLSLITGSH
jgi:hypothetical protein